MQRLDTHLCVYIGFPYIVKTNSDNCKTIESRINRSKCVILMSIIYSPPFLSDPGK